MKSFMIKSEVNFLNKIHFFGTLNMEHGIMVRCVRGRKQILGFCQEKSLWHFLKRLLVSNFRSMEES